MVSYLQVDKLTKSFGDKLLFEDVTFGVAQGQKIGLIAKNGAGKTTLLNIIAGKEDYDAGEVTFRKDLRVGYLEQSPTYPEDLTVLQACFYSTNETVRLIAAYGFRPTDRLVVRRAAEACGAGECPDHGTGTDYPGRADQPPGSGDDGMAGGLPKPGEYQHLDGDARPLFPGPGLR